MDVIYKITIPKNISSTINQSINHLSIIVSYSNRKDFVLVLENYNLVVYFLPAQLFIAFIKRLSCGANMVGLVAMRLICYVLLVGYLLKKKCSAIESCPGTKERIKPNCLILLFFAGLSLVLMPPI